MAPALGGHVPQGGPAADRLRMLPSSSADARRTTCGRTRSLSNIDSGSDTEQEASGVARNEGDSFHFSFGYSL